MEKRLHELELKVDELAKTVVELRARLDAQHPPSQLDLPPPLTSAALVPVDPTVARSAVPLVGRSLLVIAGAFVFRLITEREVVTQAVGISLGLTFASLWVFLAWREAKQGARLSAAFHAAAGALIGYSLLLETGSKAGLFPLPLAVGVLTVFTGLLLATAWSQRLQVVAWMAQVGCVAASLGLMRAADTPLPFFGLLWVLAAVTFLFAEGRQWPHLRWPIAVVLDLAALRLVFSLTTSDGDQAGHLGAVLLLTQATVALYLGAVAIGTWVRSRPVQGFEVTQTVLVLAVGLLAMTRAHAAPGPWGLAIALGALVTALRFAPQAERAGDAWFYGLLSVGLVLAAAPLTFGGASLGLVWATTGLLLAGLGRWRLGSLLQGAAVLLLLLALVPAGALELIISGLARAPDAEWAAFSAAGAVTVGLTLGAWALMTLGARPEGLARALAFVLLTLGVLGLCALASLGVHAAAPGAAVVLARTLLLCGAAVGLAAGRKLGGTPEFTWAAWTLLVLGGLKVLLQDLPHGNAGSLVLAFLALGLASIAVPRLLRPAT